MESAESAAAELKSIYPTAEILWPIYRRITGISSKKEIGAATDKKFQAELEFGGDTVSLWAIRDLRYSRGVVAFRRKRKKRPGGALADRIAAVWRVLWCWLKN